jgi:hypothetical protein
MVLPARSSDNFTGQLGAVDQPLGWFSLPSKDAIFPRGSERGPNHDSPGPVITSPTAPAESRALIGSARPLRQRLVYWSIFGIRVFDYLILPLFNRDNDRAFP